MMFRLMDEINFFFEIWCLRHVSVLSGAILRAKVEKDDTKALYSKAPEGSEEL